MCYDITTGETTERTIFTVNSTSGSISNDLYIHQFSEGKIFYEEKIKGELNYIIIDVNDESIKEIVPYSFVNDVLGQVELLPSGALIYQQGKKARFRYYSPDTGEISLTLPVIKDSDGLDKTVEINYYASYGNKVYFNTSDSDDTLYCLNLDTKEWTYKTLDGVTLGVSYCIGKYLIIKDRIIFNMETDEIVGKINNTYVGSSYSKYCGGYAHINFDISGFNFTLTKFPLNRDNGETSQKYSREYGQYVPVNGQYYFFFDKAGIFLRDYEGSEPEKQVYLFNN